MTIPEEEWVASLFVSEAGEVRSFPQHAGVQRVYEDRLLTPRFRVGVPLEEAVTSIRVEFRPLLGMPEYVQKAVARLYRERNDARLLVLEWLHERLYGSPISMDSPKLDLLIRQSHELERAIDKEMERSDADS